MSRNVQTYAEPFGSGGSDQFSGQKEDPETGLKDFGARYYNALAARWLSADSVMAHVYDPQSLNKYAYVRNDPVHLVDPDGRNPTFSVTVWGSAAVSWESWWFYDPPGKPTKSGASRGGAAFEPRGGNGVQSAGFIHVMNPSKTGPQQDRIVEVLNWIKENVDPDCANWLKSLSAGIASILGDPSDERTVLIGHGEFIPPTIAAFTNNNPDQTDLPPGYLMAVNDTGAFFNPKYVVDGYSGGSSQAQVHILLHELAHFLDAPGFQSDFGKKDAGAANEKLVEEKCGSTINAAKQIP